MIGIKNMKFIYADNAATTKISKKALEAMTEAMEKFYGNPSSLHTLGQEAKERLIAARKSIAEIINAEPNEIYFTSGGSEADNQAIISAAQNGEKKGKKHIVSTRFEHHAVLHTLKKLEKRGFEITLIAPGKDGIINPEDVKNAIREDTCLVSVMYVNNEIGTIQPIREIGEICRGKGITFHTDAVQAAGHISLDVKRDNIDMMSCSAHKFHGPRGIGFLYVKKGILLHNLIEGGAQERGKRAGTEDLPSIIGMEIALREAVLNLENNNEYVGGLRNKLISGLKEIPHCILNGDEEKRVCGNVNFSFEGIEGESLLLLLDEAGIEVSSGSACASASLDPSHVLLSIGVPREVAHGSVRISIDENNTEEETEYIVSKVKEVVKYLREMSPVWEDLESGKSKHII